MSNLYEAGNIHNLHHVCESVTFLVVGTSLEQAENTTCNELNYIIGLLQVILMVQS